MDYKSVTYYESVVGVVPVVCQAYHLFGNIFNFETTGCLTIARSGSLFSFRVT